jgi:hypothetical protein
MTPDPLCPVTTSVAALLLGALPPADLDDVLAHLDVCQYCRDELVLLAPLPGLLHRLCGQLDNGMTVT